MNALRRMRLLAAVTTVVVTAALISAVPYAQAAAAQPDGRGHPAAQKNRRPLLPTTPATRGRTPDEGIHVAPNPAAGDVSAKMLKALQRDLKVTEKQARARLVRADWAARLNKPLRQRLGAAFAGSWLAKGEQAKDGQAKDGQAKHEQEFVVAITDPRQEGLVRASGATPRLVARNEAQLSAMGARLDAYAKNPEVVPGKVAGWVVDPQTNEVRVEMLPGGRADAEAFVAKAGLSPGDVAYETVPRRHRLLSDIKGGDPYFMARPGELIPMDEGRCSVGFAVTDSQRRAGFLTAAHCFVLSGATRTLKDNPFNDPPFVVQGTLGVHAMGGPHDEAFVRTPSDRPVPSVRGVSLNLFDQPRIADIPVTDDAEQLFGSPVCKSGSTTLLTCGEILTGTHTIPGVGGPTVTGLRRSTACGAPGDSGGSVMSGEHAQGITTGGDPGIHCEYENRLLGRSHLYYTPVKTALANLGLTLTVRPKPQPAPPPVPSRKWVEGGTTWDGLDGAVKGKVASVSLGADHLQVFGRGTDDRLYTNTSTEGVWSGWQGLGDVLTEPPTVLARAGGIDVYYRGADTRPYLRRWNGSAWEAPVKLGETDVVGTIAAISPQPGHVTLFIRSSDDEVKYNFNNGSGWSGWLGLGGDTNAAPTAIARTNAAGQIVLEVYARWADDNVRYRRLDPAGPPGWQPWVNLGGIWKDTPVGVSVGTNQSWLIGWARDDTAHVQRFKDGDWLRGGDGSITTGWRGLGGNLASQPAAVAGGGGQIRVFARDANQRINMITWPGWNGIHWQSWVPLDGDTAAPVGVSQRVLSGQVGGQVGLLDAFGVDAATGQPYHTPVDVASPAPKLEINTTDVKVGIPAYLTLTGPPGAPVYWSSTHDGNQVENRTSYGQYLDAGGRLLTPVGDTQYSTGAWTKTAHVGNETQLTAQVSYTVSYQPVTIATDRPSYQVGEDITFVITGPPHQQVRWSSTVNGQPSGESDAFYNQFTDLNGMLRVTSRWTDPRTGNWVKQVKVGGTPTAQVAFAVSGPPPPPPPALRDEQMSSAASSDDRMHVVAWGDDQRYWARDQFTGGGWSPWYPLGGFQFTAPPTTVVNASGKVEVYGIGTDSAVYRNIHNGAGPDAWAGWGLVNGCCVKNKLSITKDRFNRLNVFGTGFDNAIYVTRQTEAGATTWTGWTGLGGNITGNPSAVSFLYYFTDYTFVFATGPDGNVQIYNKIQDVDAGTRTYGSWSVLGGPAAGITAVSTPTANGNTLLPFALFVRGTDQRIYYYDDRAIAFQPLTDTTFTADPVAVAGARPDYFTVMARGPDQQVRFNRQTCRTSFIPCLSATWTGWTPFGSTPLRNQPTVARLSTERLQAFGLDTNRQPLVNNQAAPDSPTWSGWIDTW